MLSAFKGSSKKKGQPPGTLVAMVDQDKESYAHIISFDQNNFQANSYFSDVDLSTAIEKLNKRQIHWISVMGLQNVSLVKSIGEQFHLHGLLLEDSLNKFQRPKMEDFNDYFFLVVKHFELNEVGNQFLPKHVSFVVGENFVISFHETAQPDLIVNISQRVSKNNNNFIIHRTGYLLYALIDYLVDHLYEVLESYGQWLEDLEISILKESLQHNVVEAHEIKKEILYLKKNIVPIKMAIGEILLLDSRLVQPKTKQYFRDTHDHLLQIIDTMEFYREMVNGFSDTILSQQNFKINQVMKVLTLISTIFIPLTFIAGVYGMNAKIPELAWPNFYPYFFWPAMGVIGFGMLIFFKVKKIL